MHRRSPIGTFARNGLFYIFTALFNFYTAMKPAGECTSIEEIREAIDKIDTAIIRLLGERYEYVKEVVRFKTPTEEGIIARERFDAVIASRRAMAEENGLDPGVVEKIYRELLGHFIAEELKLIQKKTN